MEHILGAKPLNDRGICDAEPCHYSGLDLIQDEPFDDRPIYDAETVEITTKVPGEDQDTFCLAPELVASVKSSAGLVIPVPSQTHVTGHEIVKDTFSPSSNNQHRHEIQVLTDLKRSCCFDISKYNENRKPCPLLRRNECHDLHICPLFLQSKCSHSTLVHNDLVHILPNCEKDFKPGKSCSNELCRSVRAHRDDLFVKERLEKLDDANRLGEQLRIRARGSALLEASDYAVYQGRRTAARSNAKVGTKRV